MVSKGFTSKMRFGKISFANCKIKINISKKGAVCRLYGMKLIRKYIKNHNKNKNLYSKGIGHLSIDTLFNL